MPVDQSGENILFVLAEGHVEAHIQIQYTGDPARFAWLVPVPHVPEISVGSQRLFSNLLNGTVPTFELRASIDLCSGNRVTTGGCGLNSSSAAPSAAFDRAGADSSGHVSDPALVKSHEAVGAFDVTVLTPKTAAEVTDWLSTNSFLQAPNAPDILQEYIDSGHVFVAVKLLPGAGVNEIHPLVVRYEGTAPCIPLKLTAIAATEDMGVRAFFLGEHRVVPTTYREVTLDPVRLDYLNLGTNYDAAVSAAVDEPGADGQAFVTEYAGTSTVVAPTGVYDAAWSSGAFRGAAPETVMDLLQAQGLVSCSAKSCTTDQPLVLPIVRKYLPAPAGMLEADFYSCVSCNAAKIDRTAWDAGAFAAELEERVIAPGKHASDLLAASPQVTRLFTRISPAEMTADPEFTSLTHGGSDVSQRLTATQSTNCGGDVALEIPGRPALALDAGSLPRFTRSLPFALAVAEYDPAGTRTVLFDNASDVDHQITSSNGQRGYPHAALSSGGGGGCTLGGVAVGPVGIIGTGVLLALFRRFGRRGARR